MVDFSISNQLNADGKVIDKIATITTYTTTSQIKVMSSGEVAVKKTELEAKKLAIEKELEDINKIFIEVTK